MSLSHETVLELMSLADGELEGEDLERVERLVAADEEARAMVESLRRADEGPAGAWLQESLNHRAGAGGADAIADAVMAAVERSGGPGRAPVASLNSAGIVVPMAGARARRSSRLQVAVTAGAAALALAAAVALYVRGAAEHADDRAPVASVDVPPVDFQAPSAAVAQAGPRGVEVNEIDAPSRGVSVFEIPVGAAAAVVEPSGASSVVVWVDDDPGSK
jgi:hypothetical protein